MTPAQLIATATRHQVLLEGLKTGEVNDFLGTFGKIDKTVRDILNELQVDRLDELSRGKLETVLSTLEAAQTEVFELATEKFLDKMPGIAAMETKFNAAAIQSVLTPEGRPRIKTPPAEKAAAEALKRPVQATGDLLKPLVENWARGAVQKTNNAVRNGYETGKTVPQIVKDLQGTQALRFQDGVTAVNKRHAATVVRTAVQHVASTARDVTYEQNSDVVKGVEWVSTLDGKTTTQCRSLDGKKFKLNEGPRPPIHPNCRSCTAPDLDEAFDFLDKGATRSSAQGYVDANLTYYDWLKQQDAEFQDAVLGPTRGSLLRDGGLTSKQFGDLQLDKNWQPITLAQMKQLEPLSFVRAGLVSEPLRFEKEEEKVETVLSKSYDQLLKKATPEERETAKQYSLSSHTVISPRLTGDSPQPLGKDQADEVNHLDALMARGPLPVDITAYRGTNSNTGHGWQSLTDAELKSAMGLDRTDVVFQSTTLDRHLAESGYFKGDTLLEIRMPKGTKALYLESVTASKGEQEVLLARNTTTRLVAFEPGTVGKPRKITLEVVKQIEPDPVSALTHRIAPKEVAGKILPPDPNDPLARAQSLLDTYRRTHPNGEGGIDFSNMTQAERRALGAARVVVETTVPPPPKAVTVIPPAAKLPGRPGSGTSTGAVWDKADELQTSLGRVPTRQEVLAALPDVNPSTVGVQFVKWRKATGEATMGASVPMVPVPVAEITKPVDAFLAKAEAPKKDKWAALKSGFDEFKDTITQADVRDLKDRRATVAEAYTKWPDGNGGIDWSKAHESHKITFNHALSEIKKAAARGFTEDTVGREFWDLKQDAHNFIAKVNDSKVSQVIKIDPTIHALYHKDANAAKEFVDKVVADKFKKPLNVVPMDFATKDYKKICGFYIREDETVHLKGNGDVKSVVHEFGHHYEFEGGQPVLDKMTGFLKTRTAEQFEELGGWKYSTRVYADGKGKNKKVTATEVLTTGLERLYEDPVGFYRRDPEFFELITRTLLDA